MYSHDQHSICPVWHFFSGYGDAYDGGRCRDHAAGSHIYADFLIIYTVFYDELCVFCVCPQRQCSDPRHDWNDDGKFSNVVLDYVFMFPMGMGLAGAALATAASPIVSILICSIHFCQKKNTVQFAKTRPSVRMLTASCQLGVPAFVGEFSSGVTTTLFNYLILGLAGNVGVAAYGVIANFALIFTCIFNGISQGAQPLVSRYYGEGNERAVKKILHLGLATGVVFSLLIISLVWGFTDPMVALFNSEHSVKMAEYAFTGMRLYVIGFLFAGFNIIGTGYLSASEHAKEAFTASVCRGFVAIAVCSVILSRIFGIRGVWLSFMAAEALTAGITAWALLKDRKKEAMV